ncbi:DUF4304 domain-containing protein [Mangrovibacterium diazotrophicum]|nr:DUF4304 domain-containing protein [Mangrovibacterium diazotrophicum]
MTAKDKQIEFIKSYLKPKLKEEGFRTSGQTWWKMKDDFFIVINLQNSQWNSKEEMSFCFNIGVGLTANLTDKKKVTHFDNLTPLREDSYLSKNRKKHKFRKEGWLDYLMTEKTDLNDFTKELKIDFEEDILPKLNGLQNIKDCLEFYRQFDIWGSNLQRKVNQLRQNEK